MKKHRFFTRFTPKGENIKLFVLDLSDKETIYEYYLHNGKMKATTELMKVMIDGFQNIREIDADEAADLYLKDGFKEAMASIVEIKKI